MVVCVGAGVGVGAGGVGGGATVGVLVVGAAAGVFALLVAGAGLDAFVPELLLGDGLGEADELPPDTPGVVDGAVPDVVRALVAEWLKRFMKPTTPTALSTVARQVSLDTLRKPSSRRARRRSRCLIGDNQTGT